jgi:hypothetical protein
MVPKPPFKGRPASELVKFARECLESSCELDAQIDGINALTLFLLDMDSDCLPTIKIETLDEDPNGLQPTAMVQKMDMMLDIILNKLKEGVSDAVFTGLLEIFESSVLKLYQPHYIQFVTFFLAASTKERADSFLSLLLNIIHDTDADPIARREAIAFLGSFVVRAKVLSWTHSARVARYLVNFAHSLKDATSTQAKTLLVLSLQTLFYITCWETDRWQPHITSPEFDWISRSRKGLCAVLERHRLNGAIRLVDLEILKTTLGISGRLSLRFKRFISEGISSYKQLLSPSWKVVNELNLLKPHFPFDPFTNLPRTCPLILPLCREWLGPAPNVPDLDDSATPHQTDESSAQEDEENMEDYDTAVWDFRSLQRAITGETNDDNMLMASPTLGPSMNQVPPSLDDDNFVLTRLISSQKFAAAPR